MERELKKILNTLGISPMWLGYKMWITATKFKVENDVQKMEAIYSEVAKRHKSTRDKTERAMRYAISQIGKENIQNYFEVNCKITNAVFLELICDKIELLMKQENVSK